MPPGVCRLLVWMVTSLSFFTSINTDRDCDVTFASTTTRTGKFYSPQWPLKYPDNKRCIYKFVGLTTERVKIRFSKFNLQGMSPECKFDFIDVYIQLTSINDPLLEAPMLGRFCGDNMQDDLPQLIISTKNIILIIFFSDSDKGDEGFEASFEFIDARTPVSPGICSYLISSQERSKGAILSPTYPGTYPDDLRCIYELRGSPGERIKLTFNDFSIFHGDDYCPFDYVIIKDGRPSMFPETIGVFCGKYDNITLFSSREFLYIEFVTRSGRVSFDETSLDNVADYKFDRRGFNISYEFSSKLIRFDIKKSPEATHVTGTECDVRIRSKGGSSGTIDSPGYPIFPRDTICRFYLDGEMNAGRLEKVKISFKDFVISGELPSCLEGSLGVTLEGHRRPDVINERFCGVLWPPNLTSKDPRMILNFNTNKATSARFMVDYQFLSDYGIPGRTIPGHEGECMFLFTSDDNSSGSFNSPRHPENYPPNIECVYIFQLRTNEKLLISFDSFSLGPERTPELKSPECLDTRDFLQLNERDNIQLGEGKYLMKARYCDLFPAPILAERELEWRFRSMQNSSSQGFLARYEFVAKEDIQKGCGNLIRSDGKGGVLKSPRFPLKYESRTYCEWKIVASKPHNKILIQLETFKTEGDMKTKGCKDAVLRIQKGRDMREICGTIEGDDLSKQAVESRDDTAILQFLTSANVLGFKGFQLTWTEIHVSVGACYGFKCKVTGFCISMDLRCNGLPNCGAGDNSDEVCTEKAGSRGSKEDNVQVIHIVIGTSISVFLAVLLLVCGVYHRKKFRPRDRDSPEGENVEVRYVAATSGSNTTDRLLTMDKPETRRSTIHAADQTELNDSMEISVNNKTEKGTQPDKNIHGNGQNDLRDNHTRTSNDHHPSTSTHAHTYPRQVPTPKVQKISIV
ncbi:cubilin-like isoform X2 [Dreissena polymorpha]|uniref:CUB domain-containing protein n=1 Tax=Dreissena polymorpha TaxID=45954 RepID=A0A9D4CRW3_DREPO|nr:cubilin-like isoform X2 [Dreissena polymorpha]KAH3730549.1 hypothetical protein DPMN_056539 [Dreissena polymorpha]